MREKDHVKCQLICPQCRLIVPLEIVMEDMSMVLGLIIRCPGCGRQFVGKVFRIRERIYLN